MNATASSVAFASPAGQAITPSRARPIDMVHLARQSCGDKALEAEILGLFRQQLNLGVDQLRQTSGRERKIIAHTVKGSAKAVGAFGLARAAARLEEALHDDGVLAALELEAARVRDFIAALDR